MNLRKNICIVAAAAMAVSVCAVPASAAELKGSCSLKDSTWWTEYVLFGVPDGKCAAPEFLKGIDPNQPWEITVKGDTKFILGYNGSDGKWNTKEGEEITIKSSELQIDGHSDLLKICLSKGDSVEYHFEWVVTGADAPAADAAAEEAAPAEDVTLPVEDEPMPISDEVEVESAFEAVDAGYIDGKTASVTLTSADLGAGSAVAIDITIAPDEGDAYNWNDWCGNIVKVTDDNGTTYYQWGGAQVSWNQDVDDDGTDDVIGGVNGENWLGSPVDGKVTLNVLVSGDYTIELITTCWDSYDGTIYTVANAKAGEASAPAADVPTEDSFWDALESDGYVKISDGGTSTSWGQAVQKLTYNNIGEGDVVGSDIFYVSLLNEDTAVVVTYDSAQAPEMILQSWSGGEGWAKIPANEEYSTDGVAVFTYDYMVAMYQSDDFSTVDSFYIGDTGVDLTVSEIDIVNVSKFTGAAADDEEEEAAPAEAEPAAEPAPAPAPVESSNVPATGNMSAAALAGILAAAGAAAVALRKRN